MSIVNGTSGTGMNAVADQLMKVFDRDRDGRLTTEEFTAVLNNMLGSATAGSSGAGAAAGGTRRTDHMTGFSDAKLDASDSIKYRFARAAMQFDLGSVHDKAGAEALLNQMRPAMASQGLDVLEVKGDRIRVDYNGSPLWVDVIRGATSGSPMFQWLPNA